MRTGIEGIRELSSRVRRSTRNGRRASVEPVSGCRIPRPSLLPAGRVVPAILFCILLCAVLAPDVSATSYNTPRIDGRIHFTPADWDSDEVAIPDSPTDSKWGGNEIDSVLVTWDSDSLYVGYIYVVNNNAMIVYIDAGTGIGDADVNNLNWYPRNFQFSDARAELIIAGWSGGTPGVRRITGDGTTSDLSVRCRIANTAGAGVKGAAEIAIPWDAVYELGEGSLKPGAFLKIVSVVAGGDNYGGGDSAPDNPSVDGGPGPCLLTNFFYAFCDLNSDGIPDQGFPPSGAISGTVTLSNLDDHSTVVNVTAYKAGTSDVAGRTASPPGGGAYRIGGLFDGSYDLSFEATSYVGQTVSGIDIAGGQEVTGVDVVMQYVSGKIVGTVAFRDPVGVAANVIVYVRGTTTMAGTSPVSVLYPGGDFTISVVPDGDYDLVVRADGYSRVTLPVTVAEGGTTDVDTVGIYAVRATRFVFVSAGGDSFVTDALGTVSLPDSNIFLYVPVYLEARDSLGQLDLFNLGRFRDSVFVTASLLDPRLAPLGSVVVTDRDTLELAEGLIFQDDFVNGRARLLVADDTEEVVLLTASPAPSLGYGTRGRIRIGFLPRDPVSVLLSVDPDTVVAGGTEKARIRGQLKDLSGTDTRVSGVAVNMQILSGHGTLAPPIILTDTNGQFEVEFSSTASGLVVISDSTVYKNQKLLTNSVMVTVLPGTGASVELTPEYGAVYPGLRFRVSAQIADEFGNAVKEAGVSVSLFSSPPGKLSELTTPLVTSSEGYAEGFATAAESYGAVEITGASAYPVGTATVSIEADLAAVDQPAPETDPRHHSVSGMDFTGVYVRLENDTIRIGVPFQSDWDAVHLGILLETEGNPAGLSSDAFRFPIVFDHTLKPDYIFTDKFSANSDTDTGNDYADFRRWAGPGVDSFWDLAAQTWTTDASNPNKNTSSWARHDGTGLTLSIPAGVVGVGLGDSLRVQVYCMDEPGGQKRNAFDSCPHDSTHNMVGNWWESATDTVRLHNYASLELASLPEAPVITAAACTPQLASAGQTILVTASVLTGPAGVGDVTVDLRVLGGSAVQKLYDDGTNGDASSGDGTYSYRFALSETAPGGVHRLAVTARDGSNRSKRTAYAELEVLVEKVVLRSFTDASGDDHGPNQFGKEGLYYRYPTNPVFYPGSFDILAVDVIDEGDWLDFKIWIGDLTSPGEPNAADWNAFYPSGTVCRDPNMVDLNLQNLVVLIDSEKGGATAGPPNRYADVARWDAWEYGLVADGWWKGAVVSNGSNDIYSWTRYKADSDFWICTNHVQNTIDMHVRKALVGSPTALAVSQWDIIVIICSHDGDSNDDNLGMVRWVNEGSPTEWQFGGGRYGEAGRERDSNIIDVAVSPGDGKLPGKSQEEMLDYTTQAANDRFNDGQVAVVLEATKFEDYAPPAISPLPSDSKAVTEWFAMDSAPVVIGSTITDDDAVAQASLRWRPLRGAFSTPLAMTPLLKDLWVADIDFGEITSDVAEVDGKLYFELRMSASDPSGNSVESRLFTVELDTTRVVRHVVEDVRKYADPLTGDVTLQGVPGVLPDGSVIELPGSVLDDTSKVYDLAFSSVAQIDVSHLPPDTGPYVGVARSFQILEREPGQAPGGETMSYFPLPLRFLVHYPAYAVWRKDTRGLALYRWEDRTSRWILLGGNATSNPGLVSVNTQIPGTFAVFADRFSFDPDKTLASVIISPNPFSPNGDGLYEETHVSYYLQKPASVRIEIYDMAGQLVRRFPQRSFEVPGRTEGETWDGKDANGQVVPYGIYIMRFEAIDQEYRRPERFNKAVVVIK